MEEVLKPAGRSQLLDELVDSRFSADPRLTAVARALRASEARYAAVLEHAASAVWHIDPVTQAIHRETGWQTLTGQTLIQMAGWGWMSLIHPDDRDRVSETWRTAFAHGESRDCEFRIRRPESDDRVLELKLIAVRRGDGSIQEWLGLVADVTDRVRARQKLHETQLTNREIRNELAHTRRITLLGTLAGSIAHELRQPLTAIMANARAARRFLERPAPDIGSAIEALDDIVRDDRRASQIIEHFRSLLKGGPLPDEPCDLNSAIAEVVRLVRSDASMRQIEIHSTLDERAASVRGNRVQLQQVVLNLLVNAFDAVLDPSAAARIVSIQTACDADRATTVTVDDQGPPMSDEQFARMQKPFYTSKPEGLGLGLSICREILTAHASELRAERKDGGGLTLSFTLAPHPE